MKITILGCAAMFATKERAASGYLVEIDGNHLWLDAGAGTWRNLLDWIDYPQIDGIMLTHHHPDHTTDVFQAYHARMYGQPRALPPIPLWAPRQTLDRCVGFADGFSDSFDLKAIAAGEAIDVFGARVSFHDMAHPPDTVGVRIEEDGKVFAYSSDTGPGADFSELAGDADLFICEATFQASDSEWEGHLHSSAAAEIAARYGVRRLVLTHLPPSRDLSESLQQARATGDGVNVELASDGKVYEL